MIVSLVISPIKMFEDIALSCFRIKNKQIKNRLKVTLRLKDPTEENYSELKKVWYKIRLLSPTQAGNMLFYPCSRDNNAPILPEYMEVVQTERLEYNETKRKALDAIRDLDLLTDQLYISMEDYTNPDRLNLQEQLEVCEYEIPNEYREVRYTYSDVKLRFLCLPDTEIYTFFKAL